MPCNFPCNAIRLAIHVAMHPVCLASSSIRLAISLFILQYYPTCNTCCNTRLAMLSDLQYMLQRLAMLSDLQYMLQHSPSTLHHRLLTLPTVLYKDCAHPHIIQHIAPTQSFLPSTRFAEVVITVWPCSSLGHRRRLYPVAALDHVGGGGGGGSWRSW